LSSLKTNQLFDKLPDKFIACKFNLANTELGIILAKKFKVLTLTHQPQLYPITPAKLLSEITCLKLALESIEVLGGVQLAIDRFWAGTFGLSQSLVLILHLIDLG
jgi:hypothetical protein